jgi:hypothetical protein
MSSTGATADGFDRQFGIGRAGAPRDWQRRGVVPIHRSRPRLHRKFLRGRGSPRRFAEQVQCLYLPDVRPAYRLDRPWACYMERVPETVRFKPAPMPIQPIGLAIMGEVWRSSSRPCRLNSTVGNFRHRRDAENLRKITKTLVDLDAQRKA